MGILQFHTTVLYIGAALLCGSFCRLEGERKKVTVVNRLTARASAFQACSLRRERENDFHTRPNPMPGVIFGAAIVEAALDDLHERLLVGRKAVERKDDSDLLSIVVLGFEPGDRPAAAFGLRCDQARPYVFLEIVDSDWLLRAGNHGPDERRQNSKQGRMTHGFTSVRRFNEARSFLQNESILSRVSAWKRENSSSVSSFKYRRVRSCWTAIDRLGSSNAFASPCRIV